MNLPSNPQFMYVILILPFLFGLTLTGEGVHRLANKEWDGVISIIFGGMFLLGVVLAYVFFSIYLGKSI